MVRQGASLQDRAARELRLTKVAPLMLSGTTQAEIAEQLGVDQSTISRDISTLRQRWQKASLKQTDRRIGEQYGVYQAVIHAHLPLALSGKTRSAEIVIDALTAQSKLLGLDQPSKQQISLDVTRYEIVGVSDAELHAAIGGGEGAE